MSRNAFASYLIFVVTICSAAVCGTPLLADSLAGPADISPQGNCIAPATGVVDLAKSTISCPGRSSAAMTFAFSGGQGEDCVYIDNNDSTNSYFVPMNSYEEWNMFKLSVQTGPMQGHVNLVYGCRADTVSDTCGGTHALPAGRNGATQSFRIGQRSVVYTCMAAGKCGTWNLTSQSGNCPKNGACGTANNAAFEQAPDQNLCASGAASDVSGDGPWTWTCKGDGGGTDASCSAVRTI